MCSCMPPPCFMSTVRSLLVRVTRHTSHVTRHTSHVTRHTSHVTRHTSHVTRHSSHFTRHTSHVTRHTHVRPFEVHRRPWWRASHGTLPHAPPHIHLRHVTMYTPGVPRSSFCHSPPPRQQRRPSPAHRAPAVWLTASRPRRREDRPEGKKRNFISGLRFCILL
jgi:hypothetical protein